MKATYVALFMSFSLISACQQESGYTPAETSTRTGGGGAGPGSGNGTPINENGTKEGEEFFAGKIVSAFRSSSQTCLSCHDAPRNVLGNPDASDEALYDYDSMFKLLKKGGFSNNNDFINPMLGTSNHPGSKICSDETDDLCALAIEWFGIEFPGSSSQFGEISRIDIQFSKISVLGSAKDVTKPDDILTVRAYLDGAAGQGTMVAEGPADAFNGGFNLDLAEAARDGQDHELHVYAVVAGKEELLGGSPYRFTGFAPRGAATFPGAAALGFGAGCACHEGGFQYEALWGDLTLPVGGLGAAVGSPVTATSNYLYEFATGTRGTNHPGGGRQGNAQAIANWWCAEFDPNNASCGN